MSKSHGHELTIRYEQVRTTVPDRSWALRSGAPGCSKHRPVSLAWELKLKLEDPSESLFFAFFHSLHRESKFPIFTKKPVIQRCLWRPWRCLKMSGLLVSLMHYPPRLKKSWAFSLAILRSLSLFPLCNLLPFLSRVSLSFALILITGCLFLRFVVSCVGCYLKWRLDWLFWQMGLFAVLILFTLELEVKFLCCSSSVNWFLSHFVKIRVKGGICGASS